MKRKQSHLQRRPPHPALPPAPPGPRPASGGKIAVAVRALRPETRAQVEAGLRALKRVRVVDPDSGVPRVLLYAVHSPQELIALLRPDFEPHPRAVALDIESRLESWVPAVLGFRGYLRPDVAPEEIQHCLEQVDQECPHACGPNDGRFYRTRERGRLDPEQCRILDLRASGHTNDEVAELLGLTETTRRGQLAKIRRLLELKPGADIGLIAARVMGFGEE